MKKPYIHTDKKGRSVDKPNEIRGISTPSDLNEKFHSSKTPSPPPIPPFSNQEPILPYEAFENIVSTGELNEKLDKILERLSSLEKKVDDISNKLQN
jgi:hypothetical protein